MRALIATLGIAGLLGAGAAHADLVGANFGAGVWQQTPGGDVSDEGETFDVQDDLDLDNNTSGYLYGALEHPVPFLPNVRLYYGTASFSGEGTVNRTRNFGNITFSGQTTVESDFNASYLDGTLYYELLDNVVSLDAGLNIRYLSAKVEIQEQGNPNNREEYSGSLPLPMLYGAGRVDIPATGLYGKADIAYVSAGGNTLSDFSIGAGYELSLVAASVGVEAGYRTQRYKLDDIDGAEADVNISGPYAGVTVDF